MVVTSEQTRIFTQSKELEDYLRAHLDYSYLVPEGREEWVNRQVAADFAERKVKANLLVKVVKLGAERQLVEVTLDGDPHEITVWYEAADRQLTPRYFRVRGAMSTLFVAMGMWLTLWLVSGSGYKMYQKYRKWNDPMRGLR